MDHYTPLSDIIEAQYQQYKKDGAAAPESLYKTLYPYITRVVTGVVSKSNLLSRDEVEDIVQETMLVIFEKGLERYQEGGAKFATYCSVIAKNKAFDRMRSKQSHNTEVSEEIENEAQNLFGGMELYNPERRILMLERRLEQIERIKLCLQVFVNLNTKPYQIVSSGFSMFLFHKYFPRHKSLASPGWAYDELEEDTVMEGADRFLEEMNEWLPCVSLEWGEDFVNGLDEVDYKQGEQYVSDIIFGKAFSLKDFENWSSRVRIKLEQQVRKLIYEREMPELEL